VGVSRSAVTAVHGVAGGTSPDVREGRWRADYPMIQINAAALLPPTMESMAFDPKQLWQLSILETAGIATVIVSALLIAGIAYSIW